jgi:hypothetical protein
MSTAQYTMVQQSGTNIKMKKWVMYLQMDIQKRYVIYGGYVCYTGLQHLPSTSFQMKPQKLLYKLLIKFLSRNGLGKPHTATSSLKRKFSVRIVKYQTASSIIVPIS